MAVQHTNLKCASQNIPLFEEIDCSVFILEDSVVVNSCKTTFTVQTKQFLPSADLSSTGPILAAEAGFFVGIDVLAQACLLRG